LGLIEAEMALTYDERGRHGVSPFFHPMILILTHSQDQTTDMVMAHLGSWPVFRFNMDLWRDYRWSVNDIDYRLEDPLGRVCHSSNVRAVYLRKLMFDPPRIDLPASGNEEAWCREEVRQVWHGIHDLALHDGLLALVHPSPTGRWTKVRQMRVAKQFFRIPAWELFHGKAARDFTRIVVKTQGSQPPAVGSVVMVREVAMQQLSHEYPWFVQQMVSSATHDVTVVYVRGRTFAFECNRESFAGADCRLPTAIGDVAWRRCELTPKEEFSILNFMQMTGYSFGRLDFLRDKDGLWFLEINPNGQFAWLDVDGSEGLLKAVANEILTVYNKNADHSTSNEP